MRFPLILAAFLAGCTRAALPVDPAPGVPDAALVADCCTDLETYPEWMVDVAEAVPGMAPWMGTVDFRAGYLDDRAEAFAHVAPALRPLDILLFHSDGRLSSQLIPGHFSHGALYLGTEAQLRAAGLWQRPWMVPHHAAIREGRVILDSVTGGVRLTDWDTLGDTDALGILRPDLPPEARNGRVHRDVLAALGIPFDFAFDSGDDSRLFCIELIARAIPELNLPEVSVYGRRTIVPDALAAMALSAESRLSFVGYLRGEPRGWRTGPSRLMALDIREAWRLEQVAAPAAP